MRRILLIVGLVLFVAGLVVGFQPLRSDGMSCGSAFRPAKVGFLADPGGCPSLRQVVRYPAVVLLVGGAGFAAAGLWVGGIRVPGESGGESEGRVVTVLGRPWPRGRFSKND